MDDLLDVPDIGDVGLDQFKKGATSLSEFRNIIEDAPLSAVHFKELLNTHAIEGNIRECAIASFLIATAQKLDGKSVKKRFKADYDANEEEYKKFFKEKFSDVIQRLQLFIVAYSSQPETNSREELLKSIAEQEAEYIYLFSGNMANQDIYSLDKKIFVVASEEIIKHFKEGLAAARSLFDVLTNEDTSLSPFWRKTLNVLSVVMHESYTLGNLWFDTVINDRRITADYNYEKVSRALGRRADSTGDVEQIEKIVNSVVTRGNRA